MNKSMLFEAARRAVPLPELWQRYHLPLTQRGGRFATSTTPCCGESQRDDAGSLFLQASGEWKWHCFRCGHGGSAVDLVADQEGITALQAARKLVETSGGVEAITGRTPAPPKPRVSGAQRQEAIQAVVRAVRAATAADPKVLSYLMGERGLSKTVIDEARSRGLLRTLPSNPDTADLWLRLQMSDAVLKQADMLRGKRAAAAYRPLVFLPPGGTTMEFRAIRTDQAAPKALQYGEQTYPLVWQPNGPVDTVLVVEGGIDMLSCVDLGFARSTMLLGLLGVSAWRDQWIDQIQSRYPSAVWQIGFDADQAGDQASPRLLQRLAAAGIPAERLSPWGGGKDWNDTLLASRAAIT